MRKFNLEKSKTGDPSSDDVKPLPETSSDNSTLRELALAYDGFEKNRGMLNKLVHNKNQTHKHQINTKVVSFLKEFNGKETFKC